MKTVTIYGASDDLIEIDGDLREEFGYYDPTAYLAFSDGTIVAAGYCDDARDVWNIRVVRAGTATSERQEADGPDTENYTDRVTLRGDIQWVKCRKDESVAKRLADGLPLEGDALARAIAAVDRAVDDYGEEATVAWDDLKATLTTTRPQPQQGQEKTPER